MFLREVLRTDRSVCRHTAMLLCRAPAVIITVFVHDSACPLKFSLPSVDLFAASPCGLAEEAAGGEAASLAELRWATAAALDFCTGQAKVVAIDETFLLLHPPISL